MRRLLYSESEILRAAIPAISDSAIEHVKVLKEEHFSPHKRGNQWFNTDFALWMVDNLPPKGSRSIHVLPVHENTLGAEIFVTLDTAGGPILVELVNGESIELSSFVKEVDSIRTALHLIRDREYSVAFEDRAYLRLIQTTGGISFCAATRTDWSNLASIPPKKVVLADLTVFLRQNEHGDRLIDGFLKLE